MTWPDIIQSWQAVLQVPTMLVSGAESAASKITGKPAVIIPQTVVNAATGQMATPADVKSWLPQLPDITLPDFSLSNVLGSAESKLGTYVLFGGAALLAGVLLMKPRRN